MAKSTIIIAVIIIAIFAAITGILQLLSSHIHNDPEEQYIFAYAAKGFHEKIEGTGLLENITTLTEIIARESTDNSSEIETSIQHGILSAKGYKDQYFWLNPGRNFHLLIQVDLRPANKVQPQNRLVFSVVREYRN